MSTHNICFRGEIRKIFTGYLLLSRPMNIYRKYAQKQQTKVGEISVNVLHVISGKKKKNTF